MGQMQQITALMDAGNDVTLLRNSTARKLGYDPQNEPGEVFPVGGITGGPQQFKKIVTLMQFGNMTPIQAHVGLAYREESLAEDLIGRQDVFSKYEVDYTENSVTVKEKHTPLDINMGDGAQLSYRVRSAFRHVR